MEVYNHTLQRKKCLNILIIDDDVNVSRVLHDVLEIRGHNIEVVNEGSRGIARTFDNTYDIVFIDYHLDNDVSPEVSKEDLKDESILTGANLSECILEFKKEPLIFGYTGDSSTKAIQNFKNAGVDGIIFKPLEIDIIDKLMNVIEKSNNKVDKLELQKTLRFVKRHIIIF